MLGCFKPDFSILSEKEKKYFKTLHCSLCKDIKKNYGIFSTMFLNYDLDFIYLSCNDISNKNVVEKRCVINPLKKIKVYEDNFEKYSDLTILFIYVSLLDKKIDSEENIFYKILEKKLKKNILKVKSKINRPIEKEVYEVLSFEDNLNYVSNLYSDIIINHLNISKDKVNYFKEMLKIMYYFDSFEDYTEDMKKNKFNLFRKYPKEKVVLKAREKIVASIYELKKELLENSLNIKTLEYSLQSKFNKIQFKNFK